MVVRFLFFILFLYELSDIVESSDMKNGLTSMIDNTASMTNDMEKVKIGANAIFKTVMSTNTSLIEDFVLVTFRDPGHSATFFGISLYNPDCPEMSMSGIELALQKSQKGSFLFVFTDASAKDYDKYEEVEALAQKKGSQVVFVLTGVCYNNRTRTDCLVYHKLAKATNGQVFNLRSQEIGEILKYVENSMESRKNVIASKKFPPGYGHSFEIDIDGDTKELVIAVSGEKPSIGVTNSTGIPLTTTDITRLDEVAIVKAGVKPGVYKVEVGSKSQTHVVVSGSSSVHFQHGFSIVTPSAISDTVTRPVPGEKSHLSIKLSTEGRNVTPSTVQILDMDDNVILKQHLNLIDKKEQFYTTDTIIPPDRMFKIAIKGYDANSKTYLTRMSLTPVKPQDSIPGKVKSPVVTIDGSPNINAEYGKPLQLKCRVSGFPTPHVTWKSDDKVLVTEKLTTVELPYDYISMLDISSVRNNATYSCKADNSAGNSETYVAVQTIISIIPRFVVVELPKDTTIEYKKSGQIQCTVNAYPPATVSWYKGRHLLKTDGNLGLSDDGSILTIHSMEPYMDDEYMCKIRNAEKRKFVPFTIKMTGVESPKISKDTYYINTAKDFPVDIQCQITKGKPRPAIHWLYKNVKSSEFVSVAETTDTIHFDKVKITDAGAYKCIANNVIGEDYHETELIVEYKPVISRMFEPRVTKNEGRMVTLKCIADGIPSPDITWKHNGAVILSSRHTFFKDGRLKFPTLLSDDGIYKCEARNAHGVDSIDIQLKITVPVEIESPKSSSIEKEVGSNVTLPCQAYGVPAPWIRWGYRKNPKAKLLFFKTRDPKLWFPRIQPRHSGQYFCIATNSVSSKRIEYEISVMEPPSIRYTEKQFHGVVGDMQLRIPCVATGNPKPDITWSNKDGNIASGTEWFSVGKDGSLVIKNINKVSEGYYTCTASNRLGEKKESFDVIVDEYPKATANPKSVMLEEGNSSVIIPCSVPHRKTDRLSWFKDGQIVSSSKLKLPIVRLHGSGTYTCRVSSVDKPAKSGSTNVEVGFKPRFSYDTMKEIPFVEGGNTVMDCTATGEPKPQIKWLHDGKEIDIPARNEFVMTNTKDRGRYICEVSNKFGSVQKEFNIILSFEPPSIRYTEKQFHGVVDDMQLRIPCVATGNPQPDITWTNKDGNIASGEDGSLVIKNVTKFSEGNYTCTASNRLGAKNESFDVIVDEPPSIRYTEKQFHGVVGDMQLRIPCVATGNPKPDITWTNKDGNIASGTEKFDVGEDGSLVIKNVTKFSEGNYTCTASNRLGAKNESFDVIVDEPPSIRYTEKQFHGVVGDMQLRIPCVATGNPKPDITWTNKDGNIASGTEKFDVGEDGSLVIKNVTKFSEGNYTCTASNRLGAKNESFDVIVDEPPSIRYTEKQFHGVVGDMQLRIPCVATGNPKPDITWTNKDGNIASGTEKFDVGEDDSLVVKNIAKYSEGNYTCTASNRLGVKKESFDVIVDEYPKETANPKSVMLEEGNSSVIIPCSVPHSETDRLLWFKDGRIVSQAKLELPIVRLHDSGTYTCRVSSVDGTANSGSTNVEVGFKPRFSYDTMKEIPFVEGEITMMDCTATGEPKPQIKWLHDGKEIIDKPARNEFVMTNPKDRGRYICEVSNKFGSVQKEFNILSFDYCLLDLKKDFNGNEPLMLTPDGDYASFETRHGYLRIPKRTVVKLVCPSTFKTLLYSTEINVTCEKEQLFKRLSSSIDYAYSDLKCNDKLRPSFIRTGNRCKNGAGELLTVGFKTDRPVREIYNICIDAANNPIYTTLKMKPSLANVTADKDIEWSHSGSTIDLNSLYNCSYQNNRFSLALQKDFHRDGCCFARRMLVNPKDVIHGLPQAASYIHQNIVPHWSTCSSKNWDKMEQRIRNMVKSKNRPLQVWTGTAQIMQLPDDRSVLKNLTLNSAGKEYQIPKYLWKVIQDERSEASLAIIQVNVPDLKSSEALAYVLCIDICRDVSWLRGRWRSSKHGFMYCCGLTDFERAFGYSGVFKNYPKKLLN